MIKIPLLLLLHLVIATSLFGISFKKSNISIAKQATENSVFKNTDTTYRIIIAPKNTYGYEILINDKAIIRQLSVPGKPGKLGFKNEADAKKVAHLVMKKLSRGIMPPTVNQQELKMILTNKN